MSRRLLPLALLTLTAASSAHAVSYNVLNLGPVGNGYYQPVGIDAQGRVYGNFNGEYYTRSFRTQVGGTYATADVLRGYSGTDGDATFVLAVSATGYVGGFATDDSDFASDLAFRSDATGMITQSSRLDLVDRFESQTSAVSSDGRATGFYTKTDGTIVHFRTGPNGVITASSGLGNLGGESTMTRGINASGTVVGDSQLPASAGGYVRALRHGAGAFDTATDLGTFGGSNSAATAISDTDVTVGAAQLGDGRTHAFVHTGAGKLNFAADSLQTLGGDDSWAYAVDPTGNLVVGKSEIAGGDSHAFLWDRNAAGPKLLDLNSLIPAGSGWVLTSAIGVNAAGDIVGVGLYNGEERAFLLSVPEPAALALIGLAALPMAHRRKRLD